MAEAPFTPKAPPADAAAETGLVHVEVEAVRFGGQDVPVGVLRLGRPARANAYTPAMLRALEAGLRRLEGEARPWWSRPRGRAPSAAAPTWACWRRRGPRTRSIC